MINILCGMFIGIGMFFILCDLLEIPSVKVKQAFLSISKRQSNQSSSLDKLLHNLADTLSKYIRINEFKRVRLVLDLQSAGMKITPELHIANALIKGFLCSLLILPSLYIFPIITPVIVLLSIAVYAKKSKGMESKIKKRRSELEYELPRLVFFIQKTLMHNRDVLGILESYKENAGTVMKEELSITVADMRSGNYESALTRMEARVGSAMLSDVVRGLISILRGDNTELYWQTLSLKFSDISRNLLKMQAAKVPSKVKRLSMLLLFCFMLIYVVVIVSEIMTSLGAMLG